MIEENKQNTHFTEPEDYMNGDLNQDIDKVTPDMLLSSPQNNNDKNVDTKQTEPAQAQPTKPSKAPIIVLIVFVFAAILIGALVFLRGERTKRENAEAERIRQEAEAEAARLAEEEYLRDLESVGQESKQQETLDVSKGINDAINFYTQEERDTLLLLGMKPDEIVTFAQAKIPFKEASENLNQKIKDYITKEKRQILSNTDNLYKWTNFAQNKEDAVEFDYTKKEKTYSQQTQYEKVPAYGLQLYLKLYLNTDDMSEYVLYNCDPLLYMSLKQTGSIIVTYKYREKDMALSGWKGYYVYDLKVEDDFAEVSKMNKAEELNIPE